MKEIIIGAVISTIVLVVGCIWYKEDEYSLPALFTFILGGISTFIFVSMLMFLGWDWKASEVKANMLNKEYGTNYTREEVFYAEDMIETVQQINRTRIEIQGNSANTIVPVIKEK